jgi:glycosyltransferase involved in cell wall biosynthesis
VSQPSEPSGHARAGRAAGLVVAWMPVSRRSATLAERLGFELVLLGRSGFRRPWSAPLAYPALIARTLAALVRRRPRAVVIVAPPFLAPLVAWPVVRVLRARLAVDLHSGALLDRRWRWSVPILAWVCRRAEATVVTLPSLAAELSARGVEAVVVPDPLPRLEPDVAAAEGSRTEDQVVAICGWGDDEPIEALVDAARDRPWRLAITGRARRPIDAPPNLSLTGFLDDAAFVRLVRDAAAVAVLTTRDDTLLSGAWEALALGRPLVLSGTPALRGTFGDGPVYVEPDAGSIAAGIDAVLRDPPAAAASTERLRERFARENDAALATVARRLSGRPRSR